MRQKSTKSESPQPEPAGQAQKPDRGNLVVVSDILPDQLYIYPMSDRPVFPGIPFPLVFSGKRGSDLLQKVMQSNPKVVGVCLAKEWNEDDPIRSEFYSTGTVMKLFKAVQVAENTVQAIAGGTNRFHRVRVVREKPHLVWQVRYHYEQRVRPEEELKAYMLAIMSSSKELIKLNPIFQEQLKMVFSQINLDNLPQLMDMIASMLTADKGKLQDLLETTQVLDRANKLLLLVKEEIELQKLQKKISKQIDGKVSKQQREFYLREQLKAIKKELGLEKDERTARREKVEKRLVRLQLTEEAQSVVKEKLELLKTIDSASPEYAVQMGYLETISELPWGVYTEDILDLKRARRVLNKSHYGLDDVKELILQFISTIIKRGSLTGTSILLVGPPGVGKTSVGQSIADALGRKFYRFSVGGMRDEAEIKGHRRTYIGAMPGKLIEAVRRVGTSNPVIMLDEIDKMGISFQGDPAAALLEVLDPEQNKNFLDHYLDLRFDLSKVLFLATANQLDTIPPALLDRMERIRLSGYILQEKLQIASRHLIPKLTAEHGLNKSEISFTRSAFRGIINSYAREAGVRDLEQQLRKIMRKATMQLTEGKVKQIVVTEDNLEALLGKPLYSKEKLYAGPQVGVVLGLAYTPMGGSTLYVEASGSGSENGHYQITGQLGDVMKESSSIALSYVRELVGEESRNGTFFDQHRVHLHVPAGATPKDGPSAGITMALALYSLATSRPVRTNIALTGELTLTGKVLPIGGLREKIIAARRVGVRQVVLPSENRSDFEALPEYIRKGFRVYYAEFFLDVLKAVYGPSSRRIPSRVKTPGRPARNPLI